MRQRTPVCNRLWLDTWEEETLMTSIPGLEEKKPVQSTSVAEADEGFKAAQILEMIRLSAYQFYQERGGEDGHDVEDWVRAENEVYSALSAGGLKVA